MASFITTMFVPSLFAEIFPQSQPHVSTLFPLPMSCVTPRAHVETQLVAALELSKQEKLSGSACLLGDNARNARTRGQFKPRNTNKGTSSYQLRQFAEATLGSGSLRKAVKLPEGEDLNEWLAVNGMTLVFDGCYEIYLMDLQQWSTFTTRSTSSTAQ